MEVAERLSAWRGAWQGRSRLWFEPGAPAHDSHSTAYAETTAGGRLLNLSYDWAFEGKPQHGVLTVVLRAAPGDGPDMVWFDSFHSGGGFMLFRRSGATVDAWGAGEADTSDGFAYRATGSYAAPEGPDWGWRIELLAERPDALQLLMFNIMPDGTEALAVQADYMRATGYG